MKTFDTVTANRIGTFTGCLMLAIASLTAYAQAPATPATPAPAAPAATAPAATPQGTCTLTVKVKGIRNAKGKIGVVLYGKEDGFPLDPSGAVARKLTDIDPKTMTATLVFENLPAGSYAATVLHDENLVGKMEFDAQGVPIEGYGVSNDPDSSSGPPSFDAAKFTVAGPDTAIVISMIYWQ
jgi:uncharacterized protein (DUF2141 family)